MTQDFTAPESDPQRPVAPPVPPLSDAPESLPMAPPVPPAAPAQPPTPSWPEQSTSAPEPPLPQPWAQQAPPQPPVPAQPKRARWWIPVTIVAALLVGGGAWAGISALVQANDDRDSTIDVPIADDDPDGEIDTDDVDTDDGETDDIDVLDPDDDPDGDDSDDPPAANDDTVSFTSSLHGFTASFPGEPTTQDIPIPFGEEEILMQSVSWTSGTEYSAVGAIPVPAARMTVGADQIIDDTITGMLSSTPGASLTETHATTLDDEPATAGTLSVPGVTDTTFIVCLRHETLYSLVRIGDPAGHDSELFSSFEFTD